MQKAYWNPCPHKLRLSGLAVLLALLLFPGRISAEELRIAVASNFYDTLKSISIQFEKKTGHRVTVISGSTGKHYAQIKNGAPFDLFFAADSRRPDLLLKEGIAVKNSGFVYAYGRLVLWSPDPKLVDNRGKILETSGFRFIASANPRLAPYGTAAEEVMKRSASYAVLAKKSVRGENVSQTFQYIKSGNADLGFIAYSQLVHSKQVNKGSLWIVPEKYYTPIAQKAVMIRRSKAAELFISHLKSREVLTFIRSSGYGI